MNVHTPSPTSFGVWTESSALFCTRRSSIVVNHLFNHFSYSCLGVKNVTAWKVLCNRVCLRLHSLQLDRVCLFFVQFGSFF